MAAAGIGSRVTFDTNIAHLCRVGLVGMRSIAGEHEGNEYTIYLPEETELTQTTHSRLPSNTSLTDYAPNRDRLVMPESTHARQSLSGLDPIGLGRPNTSLNTTDDDDDDTHILGAFNALLLNAVREITGGVIPYSRDEQQNWNECAQLLIAELRLAVENASTPISSVPAFLAAHLRRRFARRFRSEPTLISNHLTASAVEESGGRKRAASKFSAEDCLRYAEHLQKTGKGINNPGGYATTMYRTGEADSLIEAFLNQSTVSTGDCPDCNGTGFYHPGDSDVAIECKHLLLDTAIKLKTRIEQLQQLHSGDEDYNIFDLVTDLKYWCGREGVTFDERIINRVLNLEGSSI